MITFRSRRCTRRSVLSLAGLAATAPILAACSSGGAGGASSGSADPSRAADDGAPSVPTGVPDGMGSGQGDGVFPRTVVHFQGSTEVKAAPTKVVIISTGQLDVALTLGTVPVGSTAGDGAGLVPDYLAKAFPQHADALGAMKNVGKRTAPSVEEVATLAPDLILMNNAGKDAATLYASLSAIAPTVATQGTGTYWKQDLLLVADALGKPDTAQK